MCLEVAFHLCSPIGFGFPFRDQVGDVDGGPGLIGEAHQQGLVFAGVALAGEAGAQGQHADQGIPLVSGSCQRQEEGKDVVPAIGQRQTVSQPSDLAAADGQKLPFSVRQVVGLDQFKLARAPFVPRPGTRAAGTGASWPR